MSYSPEILRRARARLAAAKEEREAENAAHEAEAFRRYPRLREIDREISATMTRALAASLQHSGDPKAPIREAQAHVRELQKERAWILEAADLDDSYLDNSPVCAACGGSGYIGSQMCDCLRELCRQEQKKALSSLLGTGRESFDAFRLDYYSADFDPQLGASPRQLMETVYRRCRNWARTFSLKSPSMLFSGGTGLGKTYLSACIARAVADGGFSVVYDTASQLFADFEAEKFGGATGKSDRYLKSDLLIMDDLGTEMTTQFTQSALYTVINSRMVAGLPTIISTNLSTGDISARYTPQIASRLLGTYDLMLFFGKDIRMMGK